MDGILVIATPSIRQIVTYPLLIDRLRGSYSEYSTFDIAPTTRHAIVNSGSSAQQGNSASPTLLLMPAWCTASKRPCLLVKSVPVFPANGSKGLPAVAGRYVLSSLETGALVPHLIKASHLTIRPSLEKVVIWNRTHAQAAQVVEQLKASEPLLADKVVETVTDLEVAVRAGIIISCATLSCEPLVLGEWLSPGTHLDLVGSLTPSMRECEDACIQRCRIVVDTLHAVEASGDLVQPLTHKIVAREHILGTLTELVQGGVAGRASDDEITLYSTRVWAAQSET